MKKWEQFFQSTREIVVIKSLIDDLKRILSVTLKLQEDILTISDVRFLFDGFVVRYLEMQHYLTPESDLEHLTFEKRNYRN